MPWFGDIKQVDTDINQLKSGDNWGISEAKQLAKVFKKVGVSNAETWKHGKILLTTNLKDH